jgi:ethanolamine utilization microcompartment shell protein EutS
MAKKPAKQQRVGNVVRNLTDQALAIGGVTIAPGGEAVIDNWDAVKSTAVIVLWLSHGVIEVANGAS